MQHDIALSKKILRRRFRPLFRAVDGIVVSNSRDEQAIIDQGISADKIYKAPFSSFVKVYQRSERVRAQGRKNLGIPAEAQCVVYFGFVLPGRNVDVLVRALHQLRQKGRAVHGMILGGANAQAPEYFSRCQQLAAKLGLADNITWTGFASEEQIADGLAGADVFVSLLGRGADLRNTSILTGILGQLPIVTSENPKYYQDRDLQEYGCLCVDCHDVDKVAEGIVKMLDEPPGKELLAQRAARLEPSKVWDKHIDITLQAFEGCKDA